MTWSRNDFLAVLDTSIAHDILADNEVAAYLQKWSKDNIAALLHANGVTEDSQLKDTLPLLQLLAAFGRKDAERIEQLVHRDKVSAGARLDYLLPLFDRDYGAGENLFIDATKIMLLGDAERDVKLTAGQMVHKVGEQQGRSFSDGELTELEGYVNNSFIISRLLTSAPNKTTIQPNLKALDYILQHAADYRDSNQNPVIVFIPGAVSIDGYPVSTLINTAIKNGAKINDIGFFGVHGLVWSTLMADCVAVQTFCEQKAATDIVDEMGNHSVGAWAAAAYMAAEKDSPIRARLLSILAVFNQNSALLNCAANFAGRKPIEYLDWEGQKELSKLQTSPGLGLARQQSYFKPAMALEPSEQQPAEGYFIAPGYNQ